MECKKQKEARSHDHTSPKKISKFVKPNIEHASRRLNVHLTYLTKLLSFSKHHCILINRKHEKL